MTGGARREPSDALGDGLRPEVVTGRSALAGLLPELDDLAVAVGAPVTARAAWLLARLTSDPAAVPWAVLLRGPAGDLRAAAVLLDTDDGIDPVTVLASGGEGHRAALLTRDEVATDLLVRELVERLVPAAAGARVTLGPLPLDDVTQRLVAALPKSAVIESALPVPMVRRNAGQASAAYLSHGVRRTLRKARNRMSTDGVLADITFVREPEQISALAPAMAEARRRRDREQRLASAFDTDAGAHLWNERLRTLTEAGGVEIAVLHLDGALAAYVIGLLDQPVYRVLEGRFVTEWARYSPGRVVESTVLQRFLDDPRFTALDWMTGVAPGSLLAANDVEPQVSITLEPRRSPRPGTPLVRSSAA